LENASLWDLSSDIIILLVIGIFLIPCGLWAFNQAETYAKKTGKLKRSG
jgi:ABC-2 type transport system permease protein